jgi:hypothetical protein
LLQHEVQVCCQKKKKVQVPCRETREKSDVHVLACKTAMGGGAYGFVGGSAELYGFVVFPLVALSELH